MAADEESRVELTTFSCKEAYVYIVPPSTTIGHRAELWDVDHPMQVQSLGIYHVMLILCGE
jgi:hypothetical protein